MGRRDIVNAPIAENLSDVSKVAESLVAQPASSGKPLLTFYRKILSRMIHLENIKTYRLKFELEQIPKQYGGLYYFTLRMPSDYELGMVDKNINIERIVNILKSKLDVFSVICPMQFARGELYEKKAKHLRTTYKIDSKTALMPSVILHKLLHHEKDTLNVKALVTMQRSIVNFSSPIYLGITVQQSLYDRVCQHFSGDTPLDIYLKEFGLGWNDIALHCFVNNGQLKEIELKHWELLLHNIFKPRFSNR
jgi:hypothetical protein